MWAPAKAMFKGNFRKTYIASNTYLKIKIVNQ